MEQRFWLYQGYQDTLLLVRHPPLVMLRCSRDFGARGGLRQIRLSRLIPEVRNTTAAGFPETLVLKDISERVFR